MAKKIKKKSPYLASWIPITGILFLGGFLLLNKLNTHMMFIGDFAWFYLSARDMLTTGTIPLVGIPSSHPWLHQGPLWTYMLALALWVGKFHPLSGAIVSVIFGIIGIWAMYKIGTEMFGRGVGLIASLLYATSPLIIFHARMPYHTAPIPLFTMVYFYSLSRFIRGEAMFFPLVLLSLAILYQLELATVIFVLLFMIILIFGIWKRASWILKLRNKKIIVLCLLAITIPLIPILLYDFSHGFPQTLKFAVWMGYKVATLFGYPPLHPEIESPSMGAILQFLFEMNKRFIFLPHAIIALGFLLVSTISLFQEVYRQYKKKHLDTSYVLLFLITGMSLFGVLATKTMSEAYLPMLFPLLILTMSLFFIRMKKIRFGKYFVPVLLVIIVFSNIFTLLSNQYYMDRSPGYGVSLTKRVALAQKIIALADGEGYTIKGRGTGSEYSSFTQSTEYLTWWLGQAPEKNAKMLFLITETSDTLTVQKIETND